MITSIKKNLKFFYKNFVIFIFSQIYKKPQLIKRSKKDQIQLFGTKKKTSADKVLEELRNANVPAILIKLPNEQVGVFNLTTNKYEYKGDIETESTTVRSNVKDLKNLINTNNFMKFDAVYF